MDLPVERFFGERLAALIALQRTDGERLRAGRGIEAVVASQPQFAAFISRSSNTPEWSQSDPIEVKVSSLVERTEPRGRPKLTTAMHVNLTSGVPPMNDAQPMFPVRRAALDFALGVVVFVAVASCVAVTEGQASGGDQLASNWVTTVHYAPEASFWGRLAQWHWSTMGVLAMTCGALTAFNLSLARHVRTVAVPVKLQSNQPQANHAQADHSQG
jgi:hypothetical protein